MKILFRVYRRYFDLIVSGEKKVELRPETPFWIHRGNLVSKALIRGEKVIGVFVCGRDRIDIDVISVGFGLRACSILGRQLSD